MGCHAVLRYYAELGNDHIENMQQNPKVPISSAMALQGIEHIINEAIIISRSRFSGYYRAALPLQIKSHRFVVRERSIHLP